MADQMVPLVFHQRDQRANHQGEPGPQQGGRLVAKALSAAGGQDDQRVTAAQEGVHGLLLHGAQAVEAPSGLDDLG